MPGRVPLNNSHGVAGPASPSAGQEGTQHLQSDHLAQTPANPSSAPSSRSSTPRPRHPQSPLLNTMDSLKRRSLQLSEGLANKAHRDKDKGSRFNSPTRSPKLRPQSHQKDRLPSSQLKEPLNTISIVVESPPNLFIGDPANSSGILFSGQLRINVTEPEVVLTDLTMGFVATTKHKRPVGHNCSECAQSVVELHKWVFLREPKTLQKGDHAFPFSHLIPGHLPATTHGQLAILDYSLSAKAKTRGGATMSFSQPVTLSRAIAPVPEKNSLRIFPPTNLTAHITMSPIIHPIGQFTVLMRVSGIIDRERDKHRDIEYRWRLRKMFWKLEEHERHISPACPKHYEKVGGPGRGIEHEDIRVIGHAENKEGWKTDFDAGDIEYEFPVTPTSSPRRPNCDVESPTGMRITHQLVVELVVAEEWLHRKRSYVATPTGGARVLRFQLGLIMTERAGLGISWDEEQPPMYEDVPASPPLYSVGSKASQNSEVRDYNGSPLEEIERLNLDPEGNTSSPRGSSPAGRANAETAGGNQVDAIGDEAWIRPPPLSTSTSRVSLTSMGGGHADAGGGSDEAGPSRS